MGKKEIISGIYKITNNINEKVYIGASYHCLQRKTQHWNELRKNRHSNSHLQRAWNKYGEENFEFEIIERCSEENRHHRERYWVKFYQANVTGYNQSSGGESYKGVVYSSERNIKISKALTGRKLPQNSGANAYNARPVVCINNGKEYVTIKEASEDTSLSSVCIQRSCEEHTTTLCITTGKEFPPITLAAEYYGIPRWRIGDYLKKGTPCKTELSEYPFLEWERK